MTWRITPERLLRLDGIGGFVAGALVLAAHSHLAGWYGLPRGLLLFTGAANLAYGTYSSMLALRATRPLGMIRLLAIANMGWAMACAVMVLRWGPAASPLGVGHLTLEGAYVGGLGLVEWRWRRRLAGNEPPR